MNKKLRILVVLPMYGGSLPIGNFCADALRNLGHSVRVFEAPLFHPTFEGLKKLDIGPEHISQIEHSFLNLVSQAIFAHVQSFEPHLVLALAQAPMGKTLLARLRRTGIRTAMWFVEDYRIFQYWKLFAPLYDVFFVIQKEPFLSLLSETGQQNAVYLPLAALPSFHRKADLTPEEKALYKADIAFLGAGYPNRRLAFRPLAGKNFKIWGSDWDGEAILKNNIQKGGQRISSEEGLKIYSASTINLNLHSSVQTDTLVSHGDFVNPRTFELACMGAFQLVDERSLMPELFPDDAVATFSSIEDMYAKLEHFLRAKDEREAYAEKAREIVLQRHTYEKRMEELLRHVEERLGWPCFEQDTRTEGEPEGIRKEIEALLTDLSLGPHASFEEVCAKLRKANGRLTPLETGVLFLDEWRKQYVKPKS
ncbi:MAG: glycosyltransferase [Desulfovibrio sp.]|nr:glycosyltransferase [Desulfovibrio sp.]